MKDRVAPPDTVIVPMTPDDVQALVAAIEIIASHLVLDIAEAPGAHGYDVTVYAGESSLNLRFDQSLGDEQNPRGRYPDPLSVASLLWAHTAVVLHKGLEDFHQMWSKIKRPTNASSEMYAEWSRQAAWAREVFGQGFGIDPDQMLER